MKIGETYQTYYGDKTPAGLIELTRITDKSVYYTNLAYSRETYEVRISINTFNSNIKNQYFIKSK